jgi:phosphoglycerate dehydrogenase-like enzyme
MMRDPHIGIGHAAYRLGERLAARGTGLRFAEIASAEALAQRVGEFDVLLVSGLWRNAMLANAKRLRFVQSISAGMDQFDAAAFRAAGVRLASARGVNANAVAEHAFALMLALARHVSLARDAQARRHWRPMIGEIARREFELAGRTMVLVGAGAIGGRIAALARAFAMRVVVVRRDASGPLAGADETLPVARLAEALPRADFLVLAAALTRETEGLIGAGAFAALKPTARLVNVARGKVVDQAALIAALAEGRLAGAGLDVFATEPLPAESPLWAMPNVIVTPHSAGETQRYEEGVLDIFLDNLGRLARGETALVNQVV